MPSLHSPPMLRRRSRRFTGCSRPLRASLSPSLARVHGTFERSFKLGARLRGDAVTAQYRDGVLEIRVPKAEEAKPREIDVQIAPSA